jgi:hypothetical protein
MALGRRILSAHKPALRMATKEEYDDGAAESASESWVMDTLKNGIKAVGVGKSGSKPIPDDLAFELIKVIQNVADPPADWASEMTSIRLVSVI